MILTNLSRLTAANLGQLIGRGLFLHPAAVRAVFGDAAAAIAQYTPRTIKGRDTLDPQDDAPLAALQVRTVHAGVAGPTERIREALRNHPGGLRLGPLCGATNLVRHQVSDALRKMEDIERSGGRRHFLYILRGA